MLWPCAIWLPRGVAGGDSRIAACGLWGHGFQFDAMGNFLITKQPEQ